MRATQDCGLGVHATAKIDSFTPQGRARGQLLLYASWPSMLRMDVIGPMNVGIVATLASNPANFSLADLQQKRFFYGPAKACNIARLTQVPVPGHALVSLLRGAPPVLAHAPETAAIAWSPRGHYVVTLKGAQEAEQEIHLAPHPSDWLVPWENQRMRLVGTEVRQHGRVLYHASLGGHRSAPMSEPRVDPDGIDPPVAVSGPVCTADLPATLEVEVPDSRVNVRFRYENVTWNPPLIDGLFVMAPPPGLLPERVDCAGE